MKHPLGKPAPWAFTGNPMARAIQSDQMQGKAAVWLPRPFDESLHCLDAPDYIATDARTIASGIMLYRTERRDGP